MATQPMVLGQKIIAHSKSFFTSGPKTLFLAHWPKLILLGYNSSVSIPTRHHIYSTFNKRRFNDQPSQHRHATHEQNQPLHQSWPMACRAAAANNAAATPVWRSIRRCCRSPCTSLSWTSSRLKKDRYSEVSFDAPGAVRSFVTACLSFTTSSTAASALTSRLI